RSSDELARGRQLIEAFEQLVEPDGERRAAALRKAPGRRDVRYGQDARYDFDVHACLGDLIAEVQEAIGGEEELGDRAVRTGIDLALQIIEIRLTITRIRMDL